MSCDNLKENGSLCQKLCLEFCRKVDPYLAEYIHKSICFPNSMVDRITPYTTNTDRFVLQLNYNIIDDIAVVCENYLSWVIQDKFSSIVPPFQNAAHVILTDTPEIYEQQKLVLLNKQLNDFIMNKQQEISDTNKLDSSSLIPNGGKFDIKEFIKIMKSLDMDEKEMYDFWVKTKESEIHNLQEVLNTYR